MTNKTRFFILILLTLATYRVNAQYVVSQMTTNDIEAPEFYLALSTGVDNYTGMIGLGAMMPFHEKFSLRMGAGLGAWGGKLSFGLNFQDLTKTGFGLGLGYSHCPGIKEIDLEIQDQAGTSRTVKLEYLTVGSLNLTINKTWVFKRGNAFYLESGYAAPTGGSKFYEVKDGSTLTQNEEYLLAVLRPGGLILALGFLIAF